MKNLKVLKEEDIIHLIENDDINRNKYLSKFIKIICNNGYNTVFSLDGAWGSGKTVFIKKIEMLINYYSFYEAGQKVLSNNYINKKSELSEESIKILEKISENENYKQIKDLVRLNNLNAIYFNAWEHDDEADPIVSIIFEIVNKFDLLDSTKTIGSGNFASNLKSLVTLLSLGKIDLGALVKDYDIATNIRLKNEIKTALADTINDIINENCNKLIIFIDELDRCKPDFAINLLERLNHYICDDRVIIVLSTNIKELLHAINTKYGNNFSSEKYLDKFIDERLFLPSISLEHYLGTFNTMIQNENSNWTSIIVTHFIKTFGLEMREINRYIECMGHFEKYINECIPFYKYLEIINFIFIPYAVGLNTNSPTKFAIFKSGNGYNQLKEFIKSNKLIIKICKLIFYGDDNEFDDDKMFKDLENYYNLIFIEKEKNANIKVSNYIIYKDSLENFENNISLLGDIAEFYEK